MQAIWNGVVFAEHDDTLLLAGRYYVPAHTRRVVERVAFWKGMPVTT